MDRSTMAGKLVTCIVQAHDIFESIEEPLITVSSDARKKVSIEAPALRRYLRTLPSKFGLTWINALVSAEAGLPVQRCVAAAAAHDGTVIGHLFRGKGGLQPGHGCPISHGSALCHSPAPSPSATRNALHALIGSRNHTCASGTATLTKLSLLTHSWRVPRVDMLSLHRRLFRIKRTRESGGAQAQRARRYR